MTPKKREKKGKEKESRNFRTETDLDEDERKKGKRKQELIAFSAHKLANLVLQVGMKPFPLKSWPRNYGQLSWNKLAKNKEGFLPRSRLAEGILIKFPRLFPLNRKSSLWRTLRLSRKSILIKKQNLWWECYSVNIYFTGLQSSTACECSVKAMTRMTRIYSVAFPPIYNFACYHFPDYRIANHS